MTCNGCGKKIEKGTPMVRSYRRPWHENCAEIAQKKRNALLVDQCRATSKYLDSLPEPKTTYNRHRAREQKEADQEHKLYRSRLLA